jgi:hypothetical protein
MIIIDSFVMKILRFTDDTPNIRKLIGERKIFIALVRSLWLHVGFFILHLIPRLIPHRSASHCLMSTILNRSFFSFLKT